jgi:hypothetical protein
MPWPSSGMTVIGSGALCCACNLASRGGRPQRRVLIVPPAVVFSDTEIAKKKSVLKHVLALFGKYCPITDYFGLKDLSHDFAPNCEISYFFYLYLMLYTFIVNLM